MCSVVYVMFTDEVDGAGPKWQRTTTAISCNVYELYSVVLEHSNNILYLWFALVFKTDINKDYLT
jgi:hypothetical protein